MQSVSSLLEHLSKTGLHSLGGATVCCMFVCYVDFIYDSVTLNIQCTV